jgi:hypothetical protein
MSRAPKARSPDMTEEPAAVFNQALAQHARAIRELGKRVYEDVVAIGWHLSEARAQAKHGEWSSWLEAEFGWTNQTALNFIRVYELSRDPKFKTVLNLNLPLRVLYQLTAPKAEAARQDIAERIEAGEEISAVIVSETVTHRKQAESISTADAEEEPGTTEHRARMTALAAESEFSDSTGPDHAERDRDPDPVELEHDRNDRQSVLAHAAREVANTAPSVSAESKPKKSKPSLLEAWEATSEERQIIRDLVLEEYFAQADGADIYARILTVRRDEVIRAFLDELTVDGLRMRMSEEFRQALRAKITAVKGKTGKPFKKTINLRANSAQERSNHSRH